MSFAGVLVTVARNGALRRIEGGFLVATIVEWAAWLGLVVFAFDHGGPVEAGIISFAVGAPAIVVAPTAAILGDRHPRSRVLLGAYAGQGCALLMAALAFQGGLTAGGYALGIVAMALIAMVRPLLSSLLPEVARSPEELTAANVTSGMVEGFGALAGSILAGIVLGIGGAPLVLGLSAVAIAVAAGLLIPIARSARRYLGEGRAATESVAHAVSALARDLVAGATAVASDRRLAVVFGVLAATIGVLGMLSLLIVIVAIDVLGFDQDGAGYLTAVGGLGAVIGSAGATSLVGRDRLAVPLVAASVGFALAVAAMGLTSQPAPVIVGVLATGIGWSFAYVAGVTLTQRLAGDDVMTRVFGIAESTQTGAEALGGLLVPVLVLAVGSSGALVVCGTVLGGIVLLAAPTLLRADRLDPAFRADMRLLRSVRMFEPLSAPVIERLAATAGHDRVDVGATITREGDTGDRFFVMADGLATVSVAGRAAGELGPGEAFGEIALLRDVPRTATVTALVPSELLVIRREPFLEALTGQPRSRALASDVVQEHLAADRASAAPTLPLFDSADPTVAERIDEALDGFGER